MKKNIFFILVIMLLFGCTQYASIPADNVRKTESKKKEPEKIEKSADEFVSEINGFSDAVDVYRKLSSTGKKELSLNVLDLYYKKSGNDSVLVVLADECMTDRRLESATEYYKTLRMKRPLMKEVYDSKIFEIESLREEAANFYNEGMRFYKEADFYRAVQRFTKSLQFNKEYKDAMYYKNLAQGLIFLSRNDKELLVGAVKHFDLCISIYPQKGETYFFKAMAFYKFNPKDKEHIVPLFEEALKKDLSDEDRLKVVDRFEKYKKAFINKKSP